MSGRQIVGFRMRFVSFVAAAAVTISLPSAASAVVMVAHFEGQISGIHSTGSDRFGVPPLSNFNGQSFCE